MVHITAAGLSLLVVVLVFVDKGSTNSIHCYSCSSKVNEDCLRARRSNLQQYLKKCDMNALNETKYFAADIDPSFTRIFDVDISKHDPQLPLNCLKQVTKVGDKEYVIRGCQLAATDRLDICMKVKKIGKDEVRTTYCSLCNSDNCNSASFQSPLYSAIVLIATTMIYLSAC